MSRSRTSGSSLRAARKGARGKPVFMLGYALAVWIACRAVMWEPGTDDAFSIISGPGAAASTASTAATAATAAIAATAQGALKPASFGMPDQMAAGPLQGPSGSPSESVATFAPAMPLGLMIQSPTTPGGAALLASYRPISGQMAGHATMFAASFQGHAAVTRLGRSVGEPVAARPAPAVALRMMQTMRKDDQPPARLSFDGWVLWRDQMGPSLAAGAPSYGRSQAGIVLRYILSPASPFAPEVHLRASAAIEGEREDDAALGVSLRPLRDVPVRLAAEGRVTKTRTATQLRAGATMVSEIAPFDLPAGTTGEVYLQGGYVTGDFATPFIDGHVRATRELAELGDFRIDAGGGIWGGAQEDVARLDIGPTASLRFPVGDGYARLSADYRVRVAGDAQPDSGPALTLATGF